MDRGGGDMPQAKYIFMFVNKNKTIPMYTFNRRSACCEKFAVKIDGLNKDLLNFQIHNESY